MKKYPVELLTNSDPRCSGYISSSRLLALGLCTALAAFGIPSARAASATWTGGADGLQTNLSTGTNWSTGSAAFVSGDVATFDNATALGTLTWSANIGPGFGATDGLHVAYTGTNNLTLDGAPGTTVQWGLGNITIAGGAGAFSFGNGAESTILVYRGASNTQTYTNDSSNPATFASDILWRAGGGTAKTVIFAGSGNWVFNAPFRIDATQGQTDVAVIKNGTGTVSFSAINNLASTSSVTINQGTLAVTGSGVLGLNATFSNPITNNGTLAYNSSASQTLASIISGSGSLTQGAGTLTLTNGSTYSGATTVTGGTLKLTGANGAINSSSGVTLNGSGAKLVQNSTAGFSIPITLQQGTLDGTQPVSGVTVADNVANTIKHGDGTAASFTLGNLTFQGDATVDVTAVGNGTQAPIVVSGSLATTPSAGKVRINATQPFWSSETRYRVIDFGSSSSVASDFQVGTLSGLTNRQSASVEVNASSVLLYIQGDTPRWTGANGGIWSTSATGNWQLVIAGTPTTFVNGDVALFDDSATGTTISVPAPGVSPSVTLFENNSLNYTLTGASGIAGTGTLTKNGTGTLTVSNVNSYTGGTILNAGSLALSGSGTLGGASAAVTVVGGTFDLGATSPALGTVSLSGPGTIQNGTLLASSLVGTNTSGTATVAATVGGTGTVTMNGTGGTLTLTAANSYTGGTTVSAGTLALSGSGTLGGTDASLTVAGGVWDLGGTTQTLGIVTMSGAGTVENGTLHNTDVVGTLTSGTAAISAVLTGDGSVAHNGAGGVLALGGANTYTGATTVTSGTLQLGIGEDTGSISPASPITVASGATFAVNRVVATVQGTDFGTITGAGGFTQGGFSTTTLNAPNTYTGVTTISAGTLQVAANGAIGTGAVNINGFGNRLQLSGGVTLANPINAGGGASVQNLSGNNTLTGAYEFAYVGNVATTINSAADTLTLAGNLTISASLNWSTANRTFLFTGAGNTVVSGAIHNGTNATIGVNKEGTGVLTLTGTSDYTRPTFVYGGVLRLDGALGLNATAGTASELTVELDGTLGGTGSVAGNTGVYGILRPGAGGGEPGGRMRFDGSLNLDSFSTTQFDLAGAVFTGVSSTLNSGVNYGGWLKLNFTSGIYNGNYTLFELTGTPNGSFSQVTLTTTTETEVPLVQSGSVWSLTSGAITYSFDQATGVLTVTGATNPVTPGSTTLAAVAGDASVALSWGAAANADTYVLRRATTSGGPYVTIANGLGGLSYTDTGVINGTTYYYVVIAKDSASGLTGAASAEVSATPQAGTSHTALQLWRFEQFGVYDDDGSVLAGDAEDYDNDGLANLVEYALGVDAKAANASPVTVDRSGNFLTLSYPRRSPADESLVYTVQASNDLASFATGTGSTQTTGSVSTYTDTVDLSAPGARRFLRLSVSYTTPE